MGDALIPSNGGNTEQLGDVGEKLADVQENKSEVIEAEQSELAQSEGQRNSTEVVEVDPESIRPLAPSLRLKSALDSTSRPLNVTSTLPSVNWPPKVVGDLMTRKIITIKCPRENNGAVQGHLGGKSGSRGCPIGSVIRARALSTCGDCR